MASNELVDELRVEITRLRSALAYWLPHQSMVAADNKAAWNQHFALLEGEPPATPEAEPQLAEEVELALT